MNGSCKAKCKRNEWQVTVNWTADNELSNDKFSSRIFDTSPLQAEAYAVLKVAQDMQWRCADLFIKTDCSKIITSLKEERMCNKEISTIKEIRHIAASFQSFKCIKVERKYVHGAHNGK